MAADEQTAELTGVGDEERNELVVEYKGVIVAGAEFGPVSRFSNVVPM